MELVTLRLLKCIDKYSEWITSKQNTNNFIIQIRAEQNSFT